MSLADIHNHLVPGVDDGARDRQEALEALDRMVEAGVDLVLTTPHVDAAMVARHELFERFQATIQTAWAALVVSCRERHPGLSLRLGREIKLDTPTPELDDPRLRLNGGRYVLVEFPRLVVPPRSEEPLRHVRERGYVPVVAHVERYLYRGLELERTVDEWLAAGAVLQVNAPSLMGAYGPAARGAAWKLLRRGWVGLLASDYHARGRMWFDAVRAEFARQEGEQQLLRLYDVNPRRVVADQDTEPVPPLPAKPDRWDRLVTRVRGRGDR